MKHFTSYCRSHDAQFLCYDSRRFFHLASFIVSF